MFLIDGVSEINCMISPTQHHTCHTPKFGAGCQKTACCSWFWAMILTTNLHTHILKYQSNVHVYKLGYCLVYPLILCKLGIENKPCCLQSVINYYSFVFLRNYISASISELCNTDNRNITRGFILIS